VISKRLSAASTTCCLHRKPSHKKRKNQKPGCSKFCGCVPATKTTTTRLVISSVANDVLEARQQEAAIASLKKEIDRKWGQGTWDSIVDEREKRVAAKAEKQKKAKAAAAAKASEDKAFWDSVYHWMLEGFKLVGVLAAAVVVGAILWANRCTGGDC
jgi:hypothetical protein